MYHEAERECGADPQTDPSGPGRHDTGVPGMAGTSGDRHGPLGHAGHRQRNVLPAPDSTAVEAASCPSPAGAPPPGAAEDAERPFHEV